MGLHRTRPLVVDRSNNGRHRLYDIIYLPTNAATYCRPTGLLKNPPSIAASRGDDDGCCGCGGGARRHVRAGGDGAAPSASAAAASHVRDDANAYGFGRNGIVQTTDDEIRSVTVAERRVKVGGQSDGRTDTRHCLKTDWKAIAARRARLTCI